MSESDKIANARKYLGSECQNTEIDIVFWYLTENKEMAEENKSQTEREGENKERIESGNLFPNA